MTFPSKRDGWLTVVLLVAIVAMLAATIVELWHGAPLGRLVLAALFVAMSAGIAWMLFGTRYVLDGATLHVITGPLRWRIDVATITRVFPTDDPSSAPALSLDRVGIEYEKNGAPDTILVSPADKDAFIAALKTANPRLA